MNYSLLIPQSIGMEKIRLGNQSMDGGYIFLKDMRVEALLSYGVGSDISFESDFVRVFNKPAYCFDHTINAPPPISDGITYFKEGVAAQKTNDCDTVMSHIRRMELEGKPIALKMDIEGDEFDVIESIQSFENIEIIVIELHDLSNPNHINRSALKILNQHYVCFHVHGNNYCGENTNIGRSCPNTVEATFVSRRLVQDVAVDYGPFPTPLDRPNNSMSPDINCNWWIP